MQGIPTRPLLLLAVPLGLNLRGARRRVWQPCQAAKGCPEQQDENGSRLFAHNFTKCSLRVTRLTPHATRHASTLVIIYILAFMFIFIFYNFCHQLFLFIYPLTASEYIGFLQCLCSSSHALENINVSSSSFIFFSLWIWASIMQSVKFILLFFLFGLDYPFHKLFIS